MTGLEGLISTVLRAMRIDPEKVMAQFRDAYEKFQSFGQHFDNRLAVIEAQNARIVALLERMNHDERNEFGKNIVAFDPANADRRDIPNAR